jgi:hypothetical protein
MLLFLSLAINNFYEVKNCLTKQLCFNKALIFLQASDGVQALTIVLWEIFINVVFQTIWKLWLIHKL